MKSKTLILPKVSSLLMILFDNSVNEVSLEIISLDFKCLPFLDVNEYEKFHVIYYLTFVKNKSEFFPVLYPKFDMNALERHS